MTPIPEEWNVEQIPEEQTHEWLLHKHYMGRVPAIITHAFGLFHVEAKIPSGICTYSLPARGFNDGYGVFGKDENYKVPTYELSRLVINEGVQRNLLSFFVARTFRFFPRPVCLVSYADGNAGHHGYIYQATNWMYAGLSEPAKIFINKHTGEPIHRRTLSGYEGAKGVHMDALPDYVEVREESEGKFRYFQFLGNKHDVKEMRRRCVWPSLPYPKGDNERYDASYNPDVQMKLF